jgi:nitroreductase
VIEIERAAVWARARIDFAAFAASRHSVRQFTGEPVDPEDMRAAIADAAKSPSVCNRATCMAYVAFSEAARARALSFQDGNRGFGHLAGAVIIVVSDMRGFIGFGERNQGFVDGGLFAMSLAYALHARGYGVCMLNWSATAGRDRRMRRALGIPSHQAVVTMMAVGRMPERLRVAASPRREAGGFMALLD